MDVTIVGFDFYDYEKNGVRKQGGNLYYVAPIANDGTGMKSGSVYVRAGTSLFDRCRSREFSKSMPGSLIMQMKNDGTAFVTDVAF